MADLNRHLKKNKILVYFTILAFLYISCFTSCSKSSKQEKAEVAKKAGDAAETAETKEGKQAIAGSQSSEKSEKEEEPSAYTPGVSESAENAGQKRPLTQEELNQKAEILDRYFQALEELNRDIPRDTFDPQDIVDKVGKDAEALFKWVKENTYLVPYRGVLRGPLGVLMDRLGNSLDRALLLNDLLNLAGHEVRLARATLPEDMLTKIIDKLPPLAESFESTPMEFSSQELDGAIEKYISKYQLDEKRVRELLSKSMKNQEKMVSNLRGRVVEQSTFIGNAIGQDKMSHNPGPTSGKPLALKDHWWIQMKKGGSWIDLDPNITDGQFGQRLLEPMNTCAPDELEDNLFHQVKVRVLIEQYQKGNLNEKTVFEYTLKPADLIGKQILLRHVPMNWPKDTDLFKEKDRTQFLKTAVLNETEWLPILFIDSERTSQSSFTTAGAVNKTPGKKKGAAGPGGVAGGFLGALGGEESQEKPREDSYLTAEWIEYEIVSPENQSRKIRRQVFDLIGPAARKKSGLTLEGIDGRRTLDRGLAILSEIKMLPLVCQMSPDFIIYLRSSHLLNNRQILLETAKRSDPLTMEDLEKYVEQLSILPGPEYNWALFRRQGLNSGLNTYIDGINLVNYFRGIRQQTESDLMNYAGLDIIANEVGLILAAKDNPVQLCIQQGVIDTNAEALLMKENGALTENAAEIYDQSRANNIEWLKIQNPSDQNLQKVELGKDERARIEQDLAAGYIVLVPNKTIHTQGRSLFAWWRIDPKDGATLGICSDGKGQALVEYAVKVVHISLSVICWATTSDGWDATWCLVSFIVGRGSFFGSRLIMELCAIVIDICGEIYKKHNEMAPW
jgi:hypothetical protein